MNDEIRPSLVLPEKFRNYFKVYDIPDDNAHWKYTMYDLPFVFFGTSWTWWDQNTLLFSGGLVDDSTVSR
jgi:hypothetical protein